MIFSVFGERNSAVPYIPIMHIAAIVVIRFVKVTAGGGGGWTIWEIRRIFFHGIRNDALKNQMVIHQLLAGRFVSSVRNDVLNFVVSAD